MVSSDEGLKQRQGKRVLGQDEGKEQEEIDNRKAKKPSRRVGQLPSTAVDAECAP
jgi:hypothetical protein